MRVALFTPLLPVKTALADIIEGYLPHLAQLLELTVVTTGDYEPASPMFRTNDNRAIPVITYQQFRDSASSFDLVIYNLGDEPYIHGYMFDALSEYPGVVLLHDLVLHHAIFQRTWGQGNLEAYQEELSYCYSEELTASIVQGVRSGQYESLANAYPLVERVLDNSLAVVGFNTYLMTQVHEIVPSVPSLTLPYPYYLPGPTDQETALPLRARLGGQDKTIFASFGLFNSQKRLEIILRAFQRLHKAYPQTVYVLVGTALDPELKTRLAELGLLEEVISTGWLGPEEFTLYMQAVDIAVQLRYPHVGGTPYTPIRLLGLGVPTIISAIEPQAELPSNAVIRILPNLADEGSRLYTAMENLLVHPEQRQALAAAGMNYIQAHHQPEKAARELAAFFEQVYLQKEQLIQRAGQRASYQRNQPTPSSNIIKQVSRALVEMGVSATDEGSLAAVAGAIYDLLQPID